MKKLNGAKRNLVAGIAFVFAVMSFVSGCSESMNSPFGSGNEYIAGTYKFYCNIHPMMNGTVIVR